MLLLFPSLISCMCTGRASGVSDMALLTPVNLLIFLSFHCTHSEHISFLGSLTFLSLAVDRHLSITQSLKPYTWKHGCVNGTIRGLKTKAQEWSGRRVALSGNPTLLAVGRPRVLFLRVQLPATRKLNQARWTHTYTGRETHTPLHTHKQPDQSAGRMELESEDSMPELAEGIMQLSAQACSVLRVRFRSDVCVSDLVWALTAFSSAALCFSSFLFAFLSLASHSSVALFFYS